jgi:large subunit ribosomal protein L23
MNAHILKRPILTEKTLYLVNTSNSYTFEVAPTATKPQIADAVERLFNVKVVGVSTVMRGRSLQRTGKRRLNTLVPRKKKAVVTLQKGQTIALFDITGEAGK